MAEYVAGKGTTALGIIGTALGGLANAGGLLNMGGGSNYITKDEACLMQELSSKDSKISLLEADKYTDQKLTDVYKDLNAQISNLQAQIAHQAVYNATMNGTIGCIQSQIAQLQSLTKLVVPNTSVCPGWGNVTITPATTTTTTTPAA